MEQTEEFNVADAAEKKKLKDAPGLHGWRCILCPYKSFTEPGPLASHIKRLHMYQKVFVKVKDTKTGKKVRKGVLKPCTLRHPIRNFMKVARALFDDTSKIPAPWELLKKPTDIKGKPKPVLLQKLQFLRSRPLAAAVELIRKWNPSVKGRAGWKPDDFKILITRHGGRLLLKTDRAHESAYQLTSHMPCTGKMGLSRY